MTNDVLKPNPADLTDLQQPHDPANPGETGNTKGVDGAQVHTDRLHERNADGSHRTAAHDDRLNPDGTPKLKPTGQAVDKDGKPLGIAPQGGPPTGGNRSN